MNRHLLFHEIKLLRDCGAVHLAVFKRNLDIPWQEDLALKTLEAGILSWSGIIQYRKNRKNAEEHPISQEEVDNTLQPIDTSERAILILSYLLNQDMAYGSELIPKPKARELAHRFITLFNDETASYFSNSDWNEHSPFGTGISYWTDLTEATFNSGIIIIDKNQIGIAWFEDED